MLHRSAKAQRRFTEAARQAALARRREIAALPKIPCGTLALFIVRGAERNNDFGWEIRRFGAIVMRHSQRGYASAEAARVAGEEALADTGRN